MNIDLILESVVLPIIKYPIFLAVTISTYTNYNVEILYLPLVTFSALINLGIWLNKRFKVRGKWQDLDRVDSAICVVTGGSNGLGLAIVQEFLSKFVNVTVIVVDVAVPKVVHPRLVFYQCDLSEPSGVERILLLLRRNHPKIDVLINNAGIRSKYQNYLLVQREEAERVFQVNVFAPMRFVQELSPASNDKSQFYAVTVASALGVCAPARASCYGASKAASIAFHEAWTQEISYKNTIRTLLVTPGQMNTTMFGGFAPPKEFFAPLVHPEALARQIVEHCRTGTRGEISAPLYANFMGLMRVLPYGVNYYARKLSGIDSCLPTESMH
ncbi:LANO_0G12706g1_1 [Lachancea nothofagi CBS 11611]|uniref:LANO_0G12706g1_1 n=1 Tax=Lachancea nothofagi CBS 11611 TaxID=1266666 RepID=A0A1G4KK21_9SACH|nr:LANO_0G12706g1_1 [Lachancea nothofagi CBS 11611]